MLRFTTKNRPFIGFVLDLKQRDVLYNDINKV